MRLTQDKMQSTVNAFITKNSQHLSEQIFTYRNERVVVLVKNSDKHRFGGMLHGESQSGQTAYLEPPVLVELNNTSMALIDAEQVEIKHICQELTILLKTKVSLYESDLMTIALLDGIFAKAHFGWVHEGCVASISLDDELYLKDARHPLIDPKQVVANTYHLDHIHKTLLITGPNTGGKTVSLKIIGLFTLLAYSGIPLPCDNASIPMFDQIYVDIGDEQSIQHSLSTFSAHLSKLATICDQASSKSLILLDELGAGTDPVEGESLAMAILNYLRQVKAMVVATTHYSKLKNYGLEHADIIIASMQFNVESMQPSYHFIEGLPGQSYAIEIARRFGLKPSIITDAQNYKNTAKTAVEELAEKLEKSIHTYQDLQKTLITQQTALDLKESLVRKELDELSSTRDKRYSELEQEVQAYYEEKQSEADEILAELRATSKQAPMHESIAKRKRLDQDHLPKINNTSALTKVEIGQWVKIVTTNQIGQVVQIKQNKIGVYSNGIRMEVSIDKLRQAEAVQTRSNITIKSEIVKQVSLECNVIG
ncbi:MAG: endonuclease MutS2, partial [Erysipelotrichaceae bacterium]